MSDDHTADRILQISLSRNGGHTFGDPTFHDLPETGDFKKRITRKRCGQGRHHVVKLECTSPVAVTLIAASADIDGE
ncbi:MAG: hypothetical protein A3E01_06965 [Gammaproteobacteria bacterium RIFCSPHIGHO2_12_FULL_63_22]|nr:MAG: hypothetical protein A3E01_06965 [Gammaproteobacteria bacterium RIFCSPHIGHO2_12_FULL_63_22]